MLGWSRIEDRTPEPHKAYRVWRADVRMFDATPCYGLHEPWWVPRNGFTRVNSDPISMKDTCWQDMPTPPQFQEEEKEESS